MAELQELTDSSFDTEVIESGVPALVDFWGDHCPACRQISPILRGLAEEYAGRVRVLESGSTCGFERFDGSADAIDTLFLSDVQPVGYADVRSGLAVLGTWYRADDVRGHWR